MDLDQLLLAAALTAIGALLIQRLSRIEKSLDALWVHVRKYLPPHP